MAALRQPTIGIGDVRPFEDDCGDAGRRPEAQPAVTARGQVRGQMHKRKMRHGSKAERSGARARRWAKPSLRKGYPRQGHILHGAPSGDECQFHTGAPYSAMSRQKAQCNAERYESRRRWRLDRERLRA